MTPVYNEDNKLDRFLKAVSLWADYVVIADQMSTDDSRAIMERFPKVVVIENTDLTYDEAHRKTLLLNAAREISRDALLVSLDADEFLTGNFSSEPEWKELLHAPRGTGVRFNWVQVLPGVRKAWSSENFVFAFVDDGKAELNRHLFQGARIPIAFESIISMNRVSILHYHYTDWEDMLWKIRFYQCYECVANPQKRAIEIYRFYNKYQYITRFSFSMPDSWFEYYRDAGVDMTSFRPESTLKWRTKTLDLMSEHGADTFFKVHVWGVDWQREAERLAYEAPERFADPRPATMKMLHRYMSYTQPRLYSPWVRHIDRLLRTIVSGA